MTTHVLTQAEIKNAAVDVAETLREYFETPVSLAADNPGDLPLVYLVASMAPATVETVKAHATVIITRDSATSTSTLLPGQTRIGFFNTTSDYCKYAGKYPVLPWHVEENTMEQLVKKMLWKIGEDPNRGGLKETPKRVAKAWSHWFSGYDGDPHEVLKVFDDGAENYDEMVVVKDIPFYSHCEHHIAPIFGTATIGYIPDGKIVGLSKLSRITDMFARRLQVQERLTHQIADALDENLHPKGVGVSIKARHLCMESRGICQQGHYTVTNSLRGVLRDSHKARAEFMALTGA